MELVRFITRYMTAQQRPCLSHMNLVQTSTCLIYLQSILLYMLRSIKGAFSFQTLTKILYAFVICPIHAISTTLDKKQ